MNPSNESALHHKGDWEQKRTELVLGGFGLVFSGNGASVWPVLLGIAVGREQTEYGLSDTGLIARSLHCIGVVTELNRPKEHWRYWSNHKILILWLDIKADIQCYFMNISRGYTLLASLTFILMLVSSVELITWINLSCIPIVMMSQRFCFALFFGL
jgi:hypothetical protein